MSTMIETFATYKGRTYRLLWQGPTKYGQRAHLQFRDGSKDFWCDAREISTRPVVMTGPAEGSKAENRQPASQPVVRPVETVKAAVDASQGHKPGPVTVNLDTKQFHTPTARAMAEEILAAMRKRG